MLEGPSVRVETRFCQYVGCSLQLAGMILLYEPSNRQDNTYNSICYSRTCVIKAVVCAILSKEEVHIKEPLLLIKKSSPCGGGGFPLTI